MNNNNNKNGWFPSKYLQFLFQRILLFPKFWGMSRAICLTSSPILVKLSWKDWKVSRNNFRKNRFKTFIVLNNFESKNKSKWTPIQAPIHKLERSLALNQKVSQCKWVALKLIKRYKQFSNDVTMADLKLLKWSHDITENSSRRMRWRLKFLQWKNCKDETQKLTNACRTETSTLWSLLSLYFNY